MDESIVIDPETSRDRNAIEDYCEEKKYRIIKQRDSRGYMEIEMTNWKGSRSDFIKELRVKTSAHFELMIHNVVDNDEFDTMDESLSLIKELLERLKWI